MSFTCKDGGVLELSFGVHFGRPELGTNSIHFFLFFVFRNVLCIYNYYSYSNYSLIPQQHNIVHSDFFCSFSSKILFRSKCSSETTQLSLSVAFVFISSTCTDVTTFKNGRAGIVASPFRLSS